MDLRTGLQLLQILPTREEYAVTIEVIWSKLRAADSEKKNVTRRSVERYMAELGDDGLGLVTSPVKIKNEAGRFYLVPSEVTRWLNVEELALGAYLTQHILARTFGPLTAAHRTKVSDLVGRSKPSDSILRIRRQLRIVSDGIGRLDANISKAVLGAAIDAIGNQKKLLFSYVDSKGVRSDKNLETPLGLVAKDGTIYLVSVRGLSDPPRHRPLHRMISAEVDHHTAQPRPEFDLDRHIEASHQFSHPVGEMADLLPMKLKVNSSTVHHFRERPMSRKQEIEHQKDGSAIVTADVPKTMLLVPFLASMGEGVVVLSPRELRTELKAWLVRAAENYRLD